MEDLQTTGRTNERNEERSREGMDVGELASGRVTLHVFPYWLWSVIK